MKQQPKKAGRGQATHKAIEQAIQRIQKSRPKVVEANRKLSIAAVAAEAGVSRATIHNNHPDLAERINVFNDKSVRTQRDMKHSALQLERQKNRGYREELEKLREANRKMATQLAMLTEENKQLRAESQSKKVVPIRG